MEEKYSPKEAMIFSQRIAQMSKALWKAVEKDWQQWIKPYDLNINEHHILWISYHLKGRQFQILQNSVSCTYQPLSIFKKIRRTWILKFYKKEDDRRNTYVTVTEEGEKLILEMNQKLSRY